MRGLAGGKPWILMEQATNAVNWRASNAPKAPGQMEALSMQAIARGADGIMFFQWRQSRSGSEKFHSAMLPHTGTDTRTWREVLQLGTHLHSLPELPTADTGALIGLVFDWENMWAIAGADHPVELDYQGLIKRWHAALHRQHYQVDIVHPGSDLTGYRLVIAPHLYLLRDEDAASLTTFVAEGGHLLVGPFSDIVDEHDAFRDGGYTTQLGEMLGLFLEDFGALVPPHLPGPGQRHATVGWPDGAYRGEYVAEELRVKAAKVIARYTDGRLTGQPAATTNAYRDGRAHYLGTIPDDAGLAAVTGWAARQAGISPLLEGINEHVELGRRHGNVFAINHGLRAENVRGHVLRPFEWTVVRS